MGVFKPRQQSNQQSSLFIERVLTTSLGGGPRRKVANVPARFGVDGVSWELLLLSVVEPPGQKGELRRSSRNQHGAAWRSI